MPLTKLFFQVMPVVNAAVAGLAVLRAGVWHPGSIGALVAAVAVGINTVVVVPRALAAGRSSARERKEEGDSKSATDFAVQGGSKTQTKSMHQAVVLFTLVMVGGQVANILLA